jgi:3-oxosteroid 1-dehydrogenase
MSDSTGYSRRRFLGLVGAAATGVLGCATRRSTPLVTLVGERDRFDAEHDVIVVGGGAVGGCAAIFARDSGADTVILEKSGAFGGTTAKSSGVLWVPRPADGSQGRTIPSRGSTLRRFARASFPASFDPNAEWFGLSLRDFELLASVYDYSSVAVSTLAETGALRCAPAALRSGPLPDFLNDERKDIAPTDRRLRPVRADGSLGNGMDIVRQVAAAIAKRNIPVRVNQRVTAALTNASGSVVGVETTSPEGKLAHYRARRGVIFATGGYAHDRQLLEQFQPGPVYGGSAVPTNEGDFLYIAAALGARLGHMGSAWYAQLVFEQAVPSFSTPDVVFMPPGDSMILVNRFGRRVVNEKANHHERPQVHFHYDPTTRSWINQLLFMVYDRRTAELFAGRFPIPTTGASSPHVVKAATLERLAVALDKRLARLAPRSGGVMLDIQFPDQLAQSIRRFNKHAERGLDLDFDRGGRLQDRAFHAKVWSVPQRNTAWPANDKPNVTMYPIVEEGPYYAIILAAGMIDTHGGPIVDANARVLSAEGRPIPGLYGAGNCVASPTGRACFGHGATLATALAFAYLAGSRAAGEREKSIA